MRYVSICSGIEAASVAWHPLGWTPLAFAEVDKAASAVLAHHYPTVPNVGDFTGIQGDEYGPVDVFVGGTPCQDFSVAGLRAGMAGARGQLTLEYARLAARMRPRWLVWENVPGVLSADGGRAFGGFLGILGECGYGFAYRILDAQYCGVPQRRRRVFLVGHLGDWRRAAAVLFERHSLQGHPAPRREAREDAAPTIAARTRGGGGLGTDFDCDGGLIASTGARVALPKRGMMGRQDYEPETHITHTLRGGGFDASEDGTGRGTPLVAEPYTLAILGRGESHDLEYRQDGVANALLTPNGGRGGIGVGAIAFDTTQITSKVNRSRPMEGGKCHPLAAGAHAPAVATQMAVRRLTPRECERLQGFPDDYTLVPYRGRMMADGPRYKMLGNSMAVPCMRWIGERIQMVEQCVSD